MNQKLSKEEYYLGIAESVAAKSTCLRRKYGAIIVHNDEVISTGYNGSPRGCVNCSSVGVCMRNILGSKKGDAYNLCLSVHAEQNAIISAARRDMIGATLYIVGIEAAHMPQAGFKYADPTPCLLCHRMIINSGIVQVYGKVGQSTQWTIEHIDCSNERFMERITKHYTECFMQEPDPEKRNALVTKLIEYERDVKEHYESQAIAGYF